MCLALYAGSSRRLPEQTTPDLSVEALDHAYQAVSQWFTQPVVQHIGAHTGCSYGFPSVVAESVIEYYDGIWDDVEDRAADLRSVAALVQLLRAEVQSGESVELLPVWYGDEGDPPKGVVEWSLEQLVPETMLFTQGFLYVVRSNNQAA